MPFVEFQGPTTVQLIHRLNGDDRPLWGNMSAQHMIEHLTLLMKISVGKIKLPVVTPEERLPGLRKFLLGKDPFPKYFKAPHLPAEPLPLKYGSLEEAKEKLIAAIAEFEVYHRQPHSEGHPVFGSLNKEEWIAFHNKHFTHHLQQFGLLKEIEHGQATT